MPFQCNYILIVGVIISFCIHTLTAPVDLDYQPSSASSVNKSAALIQAYSIGKSGVMTDDERKRDHLNDKLVFEGIVATNSHNNDVIIFPKNDDKENFRINFFKFNTAQRNIDDNEIDLSGSFTPSKFTTTPPPPLELVYNLNAICSSYAHLRFIIQLNANATSGTHTFPNGTQITFARCEVILIKHPERTSEN
jgi:hypothetical protein